MEEHQLGLQEFDLILLVSTLHELNLQFMSRAATGQDVTDIYSTHTETSRIDLHLLYSKHGIALEDFISECIRTTNKRTNAPIRILDIGCGLCPYHRALDKGIEGNIVASVDLWDKNPNIQALTSRQTEFVDFRKFLSRPQVRGPKAINVFDEFRHPESAPTTTLTPWLYENLRRLLSHYGCLLIGEFYYPDYLTPDEQCRSVEILRQIAKHGDPPEAFIRPSRIISTAREWRLNLVAKRSVSPMPKLEDVDPQTPLYKLIQTHNVSADDWTLLALRDYNIFLLSKQENLQDRSASQQINPKSRAIDSLASTLQSFVANLPFEVSRQFKDYRISIPLNPATVRNAMTSVFGDSKSAVDLSQVASTIARALYQWRNQQVQQCKDSLSIWFSISSHLLGIAQQKPDNEHARFDATAWLDANAGHAARGYRFKMNSEEPLPDGVHDWSSIGYNYLLAPNGVSILLNKNSTDITGPSIHEFIVRNSLSANGEQAKSTASVLLACIPREEDSRVRLLQEVSDQTAHHIDSALTHVSWIWKPEIEVMDVGRDLDETISRNVRFTYSAIGAPDDSEHKHAYGSIRQTMASVFLDFIFLTRDYAPSQPGACHVSTISTALKDRLKAFKDRWLENSSTLKYVESYEEAISTIRRAPRVAMLPASYRDNIGKAYESACKLAERLDLSGLPQCWLTYAIGNEGSQAAIPSLMLFSRHIVPHEFAKQVTLRLLRPIAFEYLLLENNFYSNLTQEQIRTTAAAAARASVLARNFSHVIGSHVIWHPALTSGLLHLNDLEDKANELIRDANSAQQNRPSSDVAGRVSGRQYYDESVSSLLHAADSLRDYDVHRLQGFHHYLQERFDFIARAIDEQRDREEPVSLVADVLNGFLRQDSYIDVLLADLGLRKHRIQFRLTVLNKGCNAESEMVSLLSSYDSKSRCFVWRTNDSPSEDLSRLGDVLVGLPGGMITCHAFYTLIENVMRNSLKYGNRRSEILQNKEHYVLNIRLTRNGSGVYNVTLWDNVSQDFDGNLKSAQSYIAQPLIGSDGAMVRKGLGFQEMKIAALMLRPRLQAGKAAPSADHILSNSALHLDKIGDDNWFCFSFDIAIPTLISLLDLRNDIPKNIKAQSLKRYSVDSVLDWLASGSHFGVILDGETEQASPITLLDKIAPRHFELAYRTIIITTSSERKAVWQSAIDQKIKALALPERKLFVHDDKELHTALQNGNVQGNVCGIEVGNGESEDEVAAQKLTIRLYEIWLKLWKGGGNQNGRFEPWKLLIGFDRARSEHTWSQLGRFKSCVIDASPAWPDASHAKFGFDFWQNEYQRERGARRAIVFDNHGRAFGALTDFLRTRKLASPSNATRFYHSFSSENIELFQHLANPPSSPFGFAFFIFQLVEACLTDIAVVDERIVSHLCPGGASLDHAALRKFHETGIFPVVRFENRYYTATHQLAFEQKLESTQEGLSVLGKGAPSLRIYAEENVVARKMDVLLIHEGTVDLIAKNIHWDPVCTRQLWRVCPHVVRTSGRGRRSSQFFDEKTFAKHLPFIEFSEVSSTCLTSLNKAALAKGLLGARGEELSTEPNTTQ